MVRIKVVVKKKRRREEGGFLEDIFTAPFRLVEDMLKAILSPLEEEEE